MDQGGATPFRPKFLHALQEGDWGYRELIPETDKEGFREAVFELTYKQHGGSGMNFTLDEVLDLEVEEIEWYRERLEDQRTREAKAIKNAGKVK